MKVFLYICLLFFIGTIVYNLIAMDMRMDLLKEQNKAYLIGTAAGLLGLLLTVVLLRFQSLKDKIKKLDNK